MSPLFNIHMDGVVSEVNLRILVNLDDREWKINQLLFKDDTALVADSEKKLCQFVEEFGSV